jgi:hypothetical protein
LFDIARIFVVICFEYHLGVRKLNQILMSIVVCSIFAFGTVTPASAASAINGSNKPTSVSGKTNGQLPASDLINVTANCKTLRADASSLSLLLQAARQRNITLGTTQCYRSLNEQVSLSNRYGAIGLSACVADPTRSSNGTVVGTSNHGWGKAVDFDFGGGQFGTAGYNFLKARAGLYGWNHPSWAEPGGSACPEAWHWEWVGDGGTLGATPIRADVISLVPAASDTGYATVTGLGAVDAKGSATNHGGADSIALNWVIVGASPTADRGGYWMAAADGGVFSFGNANFYGSKGGQHLNQPIVGMAATPSGHGYWLVAADGGVFTFGDANFYGSTGATHLNKPVVSMIPTADGGGYWLVASDGGIFTFGNATYYGSMGATPINQPVVSGAVTASGHGYWLVASDGGIFTFGDARYMGGLGAAPPPQPVVGITPTSTGNGYWLTVANNDVYAYGDANTF